VGTLPDSLGDLANLTVLMCGEEQEKGEVREKKGREKGRK
jgi:hypothetical protein